MKKFGRSGNEDGFALILSMMVMAGMSVLAISVYTTATTDMYIARNENESKKAFYLAETGLEEVLGRLDVKASDDWFVGEDKWGRKFRLGLAGGVEYTGDDFASSDLNLAGLKGTYTVAMDYATEATDTWCKGACDGEIVLYGEDFGFGLGDMAVPDTGVVPVYEVISDGQTPDGTKSKITAYVTESSLNVVPPAGDVFSNQDFTIGNPDDLDGSVSAPTVTGCDAAPCSTEAFPADPVIMDTYLGMPLDQLSTFADPPSPYAQEGGSAETYDIDEWSAACSTNDDASNEEEHICDNDADLIVIDNAGNGDAKVNGGAGRGILVVRGDFDVAGNLVWEGMIYVMGDFKGNGNVVCFGTIMVNGAINLGGTLKVRGSEEIANSVAGAIGFSRMVRWSRM